MNVLTRYIPGLLCPLRPQGGTHQHAWLHLCVRSDAYAQIERQILRHDVIECGSGTKLHQKYTCDDRNILMAFVPLRLTPLRLVVEAKGHVIRRVDGTVGPIELALISEGHIRQRRQR